MSEEESALDGCEEYRQFINSQWSKFQRMLSTSDLSLSANPQVVYDSLNKQLDKLMAHISTPEQDQAVPGEVISEIKSFGEEALNVQNAIRTASVQKITGFSDNNPNHHAILAAADIERHDLLGPWNYMQKGVEHILKRVENMGLMPKKDRELGT